MTKFYLIRHGQKENTQGNPALTIKGELQADKTGKYLAKFPISQIVSSPLLRTRQTSQKILSYLQVPINFDFSLRERVNWGDSPNQTFEEFISIWNEATWDRNIIPAGGNSSSETGKRMEILLENLSTYSGADKHIALVTHGGAIADLLRNIFPQENLIHLVKKFPLGDDFDIPECSITILEKNRKKYKIIKLVSCDHLNDS